MPPNVSYIQQTPIFNFNDSSVTSVEFQDYMTQLTQAFNNMALVVNQKQTGFFDTVEFTTSQFWYPVVDPTGVVPPTFRPGLRTVYPFAMQNGTIDPVQTIAHELTFSTSFMIVGMWGVANWPNNEAINLPYTSISGPSAFIEVEVNTTDIVITTQFDYSAYTNCFICLDYVQSN